MHLSSVSLVVLWLQLKGEFDHSYGKIQYGRILPSHILDGRLEVLMFSCWTKAGGRPMEKSFWGFSIHRHPVLFVWPLSLCTGVNSQQKVQQNPESLIVSEGAMTSLNCTFSDRNFQYFWWYRQHPWKGPTLLMSIFSNGEKKEGRLTVQLNKDSLHISLHIRDS